jgi:hypothetical protein
MGSISTNERLDLDIARENIRTVIRFGEPKEFKRIPLAPTLELKAQQIPDVPASQTLLETALDHLVVLNRGNRYTKEIIGLCRDIARISPFDTPAYDGAIAILRAYSGLTESKGIHKGAEM